jgi:hypothetical protein
LRRNDEEVCKWKRELRWSQGDRLCQIIRQHQIDPNLVKAYATDFCGVKPLREATREQVENFVVHLVDWPKKTAMPCFASSTAIPARKKMPLVDLSESAR